MRKYVAAFMLLAGSSSPAFAHTLSWQEGVSAVYHQVLGLHHLPMTILFIAVTVALLWRLRTSDN